MIDKKIGEREDNELKKINHYLDRRKVIMKNTQFGIEDIFGNVIDEQSISRGQITKPNNF